MKLNLRIAFGLLSAVVFGALAIPATAADGASERMGAVQVPDADKAVQAVHDRKQAAYREVLARYDEAIAMAPRDPVALIKRCEFISHFTDEESTDWVDTASDDFESCSETVEKRWPNAPEAKVFLFEQEWGDDATEQGEQLLAEAATWPKELRRRLVAGLSRRYEYSGNTQRAGELAADAARLGEDERVSVGVEHLASKRQFPAAAALLRNAPVAGSAWLATKRVKAALKLPDPQAAVTELRRYASQEFVVAAAVSAKAHLKAGDVAAARKVLRGAEGNAIELSEARFEAAMAAGDVAAASEEVKFTTDGEVGSGIQRFAILATSAPSALLSGPMLVAAFVLLVMFAALALSPALLLIPVHYRGLVRRMKGKQPQPVIEGVGIRHAWYALAVVLCVPMIVLGVLEPHSLQTVISGSAPPEANALFRMTLWGSVASLTFMAPMAYSLGRFQVMGNRETLRHWWRVLLSFAIVLSVGALIVFWNRHAGDTSTMQTKMVETLITKNESAIHALLAFVVIALLAPICEELVFRGLLLGGMSRHISFGWANLLQATLFSLVHADAPRFAYYLTLGLLAGWLVKKSRSLAPAIALHAINNAVVFIATQAR